jgi:GntR family transcriptional regulator, transcriptional repressor for pyruvate dehydrogenase complex
MNVATLTRRPKNLAQELVERLMQDIRAGQLVAGGKLPTEAAFMERFGVSRTVVREALSRMQAAGMVQTRHGVGTFLLSPPDAPSFRVSTEQLGTLRDVIALLELRISVETEAAALAAARRSEENLQAMRVALQALTNALEAGTDAVSADFSFHQEIARATQNHHFVDLMNSLGAGAIPRARLQSTLPDATTRQAYLRRVNQEHESIYNAISAQDSEAARAAVRTHLTNSRERLKKGQAGHS